MAPSLSSRAQEILAAIECDVDARRPERAVAAAGAARRGAGSAPRRPAHSPARRGDVRTAAVADGDAEPLLELVDALSAEVEEARVRLDALTAVLDETRARAGVVGAPVAEPPAPAQPRVRSEAPPTLAPPGGPATRRPRRHHARRLEVIDLHHHLLPGVDDGPATLDESLALARAAVASGTTTVVATPHVSWEHSHNTAARIAAGVTALERALEAERIPLRVLAGGEVAATRAVELPDEELHALHLGGGPYLLVECPFTPTATGFAAMLETLSARGHAILLAHPERSPAFQREPRLVGDLVARGVLTQVTASALTGRFGRTARDVAHMLVREGLAHVIASDAHSVQRRPPGVLAALEAEGFASRARLLTGDVPRAILDGTKLPELASAPAPRAPLTIKRLIGR